MAPRAPKISDKQRVVLLDYFEAHPELVSSRLTAEFTKVAQDNSWAQLIELLHSDGLGAVKDLKKWKKSWADWKSDTKAKAAAIKNAACGTGGGTKTPLELTEMEKRLLGIVGEMCVGGNEEVLEVGFGYQNIQEPQVAGLSREVIQDRTLDEELEFLPEPFNFEKLSENNLNKSGPTVSIPTVGCLSENQDGSAAQKNPLQHEDASIKSRKRKRNVRTEATEHYERATETLKDLDKEKNNIKIAKNFILKGIQTAMEQRNVIELQKANALEQLSASMQNFLQK